MNPENPAGNPGDDKPAAARPTFFPFLTDAEVQAAAGRFPGMVRCLVRSEMPQGDVEVFVRPPSRAEFKRYKARQDDRQWKSMAQEELITDCVIHPNRDNFQKLLDTPGYAAVADAIGNIPEVANLLGINAIAQAK